jgi:PAS domain S-box-containing protein
MIDDQRGNVMDTSPKNRQEKTHPKSFDKEFIDFKEGLYNIIRFLPDATFVIDSTGTVIAWNLAIEEITQIKADKMLGKDNYEYALPFYGERRMILIDLVLSLNKEIEEKYDGLWRDGSNITGEIFIPSLNGNPTYLWCKATPLHNQEGAVMGAIESIRDITPEKQAEKELKQLRSQLEELNKERKELRKINQELKIEIKKKEAIISDLKTAQS